MSDPDTPAPITPAQRAELARLCEAATAGPWISSVSPDEELYNVLLAPDPDPPKGARPGQTDIMLVFATMWGGDDASQVRDLDFIAAARTALPALLSALSRAEQERDAMRPVVAAAELAADSITESRHMLLWKWERTLCGAVRDYRREGEPGSAQP